MVSKPQVDIANNQDVLDSLNHGFEEASGIFSSLLVVATKLSPENTATIMDTLMTTALILVSTPRILRCLGLTTIHDSMMVSLMPTDENPMKNPKTSSMKKLACIIYPIMGMMMRLPQGAILRGRCSWIFFSSTQSWAVFQIPPSRAMARS